MRKKNFKLELKELYLHMIRVIIYRIKKGYYRVRESVKCQVWLDMP